MCSSDLIVQTVEEGALALALRQRHREFGPGIVAVGGESGLLGVAQPERPSDRVSVHKIGSVLRRAVRMECLRSDLKGAAKAPSAR